MKPYERITLFTFFVIALLLLAPATAFPTDDPPFTPTGKLLSSDGESRHNFGYALDVDGQTAAVGAPGWNNEGKRYQGAAYIFTRTGNNWTESAILMNEDASAYEGFGNDVTLDSGTLAVGAFAVDRLPPNFTIDAGAVVVYTGAGDSWTRQVTLMPDDLIENNFFGYSVALDGDTLIVGAPTYGSADNESAYVFIRSGNTWSQQGKLTAPGEPAERSFGRNVAIHGDIALVGAPGNITPPLEPGVVYIFTRAGGVWSPAGSIAPADSQAGDNFGCDIDFDGQTIVISACEAYGTPPDPGKAYVFVRDGNTWTQQAKLIAEAYDLPLGVAAVALNGNRIVLGSADAAKGPDEPIEWTGAAFVYERQGTEWTQVQVLYADDAQTDDSFGSAVALSADGLLVGARDKSVSGNDQQGVVYTFTSGDGEEPGYKLYLPGIVSYE